MRSGRLAELAARNAAHGLEGARLDGERSRLRRFGALEELREALNLESLPLRIECFDISNLGESATVASMVVFEQGVAKKSDYRIFGIGHGQGQDDFASMAEAVRRRFTRLANATSVEGDYDPGFAAVPNLVVIDGGKGQLVGGARRARRARPAARRRDRAREADRGGVRAAAGRTRSCSTRTRPACCCCGGSATRRTGSRSTTTADGARGARAPSRSSSGCRASARPASRRCSQHFGAPSAILDASVDELEAVPGLPPRTARAIHAFLHKTGGAGPSRVP